MTPPDPPLFEAFKLLRTAWPARGWSWDSRFTCLTSSFSADFEARAHAAVLAALPEEFTAATLATAPPRLREAVERGGGLRSAQLAFGGGDPRGLYAFGLWWPWGDSMTISFRVGLCDVEPNFDPYPRVREIFNVSV